MYIYIYTPVHIHQLTEQAVMLGNSQCVTVHHGQVLHCPGNGETEVALLPRLTHTLGNHCRMRLWRNRVHTCMYAFSTIMYMYLHMLGFDPASYLGNSGDRASTEITGSSPVQVGLFFKHCLLLCIVLPCLLLSCTSKEPSQTLNIPGHFLCAV